MGGLDVVAWRLDLDRDHNNSFGGDVGVALGVVLGGEGRVGRGLVTGVGVSVCKCSRMQVRCTLRCTSDADADADAMDS